MLEVIANYLLLKSQINELIQRSGYRNDFIVKKIGMRPDYFAVKKQRGNWSDDEIKRIVEVIESEDVTNFFDAIMIKNCLPGNTVTSAKFEKIMGW